MLVRIEIDLTKDTRLLNLAQSDDRIFTLMSVYDASGDEQYLFKVGENLWKKSDYADQVWEICEGDLFDFVQSAPCVFAFLTSEQNACLFVTGFSNPKIARVVHPMPTLRSDMG